MNLSDYYTSTAVDRFSFTRENGSHFAKDVAGDFNPLHDQDAKKFCIPGDLLFALALSKLGVSKKMRFNFTGMVTEGISLKFSLKDQHNVTLLDDNLKEYLSIEHAEEVSYNEAFANALAKSYVAFSGHTFPHVLVPLMADKQVMINPARPLVIYQKMSIDLDCLDFTNPVLEVTDTTLEIAGKRGSVCLKFCFKAGNKIVGHGEKVMVLSGLREFDSEVINALVVDYDKRKQAYSK